jgi:hypothetical protein
MPDHQLHRAHGRTGEQCFLRPCVAEAVWVRVVHFRKIAQTGNDAAGAVARRGELPLVAALPEEQFIAYARQVL